MTPKRINVEQRKDLILAITIGHYIQTVTPVSSGFIAQKYPEDVSSATIRNILSELEEEGYLSHPHTSAGRVPTQQGYRYYVDHLMHEIKLLEEEQTRIKAECEIASLELEHLLAKTSQVLSNLTQYTSIVSVDGQENKLFCYGTNFVMNYADYQDVKADVQRISQILAALEEKEGLLDIINRNLEARINIFIGQEILNLPMEHCSLVVSRYQLRNGSSGRIAVLGPTRMNYERVVGTLDYMTSLLEEIV